MSSEFEKLAAELEVLAKAQPVTEEDKVLAAAKEAGVDTDQVGDADDTNPDADADADGDLIPDNFSDLENLVGIPQREKTKNISKKKVVNFLLN